jgi:hypothetical protein
MLDPHASVRDRSTPRLVQVLTGGELAELVTRFDAADWQQVARDGFRHGVAPLVWARVR